MKLFAAFCSAILALFLSLPVQGQITPPYYNPANVRITGGNINGTTIGGTTPAVGTFTNLNVPNPGTISVGSGSGTDSGLVLSHFVGSGYGGIWSTGVTPSTINYALAANASTAYLNGTTESALVQNGNIIAKATSAGLTVSDGKTLQVGSGATTSAGLIAGYSGTSGYGAIWSTGVTPSTTNYSFTSNAASTALNASTNINLSIANSPIVTVTGTQAKAFGGSLVRTNPTNYVSGTGTAGVDNTAQAVVTIALAAGTLSQVGDRIRVRVYWTGDTGTAITGTLKINGVTIADTTDSGAASLQVSEAWLHYIDNTHANIIENENGALGNNSAVNVAGFSWNTSQNIVISQNAIANNHIVVYFLAADIFPK